jgi:hypothetical protein
MRWLDRLLRNFFTHARQTAIEKFYTGQLRLLDEFVSTTSANPDFTVNAPVSEPRRTRTWLRK